MGLQGDYVSDVMCLPGTILSILYRFLVPGIVDSEFIDIIFLVQGSNRAASRSLIEHCPWPRLIGSYTSAVICAPRTYEIWLSALPEKTAEPRRDQIVGAPVTVGLHLAGSGGWRVASLQAVSRPA